MNGRGTVPVWLRHAVAPLERALGRVGRLVTRRLSHRHLVAVDVAIAVVLALLGLVDSPATWSLPEVGVAALAAAPIAVRRRYPTAALVAAVALSAPLILMFTARITAVISVAMTLYVVALTASRVRAGVALLVSLATVGVVAAVDVALAPENPRHPGWPDPVTVIGTLWLVLAAAWAWGRAVAERRAYQERAVAQRTQQAVTEERLRIARELHDVVGHSMGVIAVKASVAAHVAQQRPDEVRDALRVIEATSRDSLAEIRRVLGVLRDPEQAFRRGDAGQRDNAPAQDLRGGTGTPHDGGDGEGPTGGVDAPELAGNIAVTGDHAALRGPGLARLGELADHARAAGIDVDLSVRSEPSDGSVAGHLPEAVGTSVYRIVQEGLTNVVKHAPGARCRAVVTVTSRHVRIEISDDGGATTSGRPDPPRGGHGLQGMRERVAAYGGTFTAGPKPEGGFEVSAAWQIP